MKAEKPPKPTPAAPVVFRLVSPDAWKAAHNGMSYEEYARKKGWLDDEEDEWGW